MVIGVLVFYFLGQPNALLDHTDSVSLDIDKTVSNELNEVPLEYIGIKYLLIQLIGQICILVFVFMIFKKIRKKKTMTANVKLYQRNTQIQILMELVSIQQLIIKALAQRTIKNY